MGRGAWQVTAQGVTKSRTWLSTHSGYKNARPHTPKTSLCPSRTWVFWEVHTLVQCFSRSKCVLDNCLRLSHSRQDCQDWLDPGVGTRPHWTGLSWELAVRTWRGSDSRLFHRPLGSGSRAARLLPFPFILQSVVIWTGSCKQLLRLDFWYLNHSSVCFWIVVPGIVSYLRISVLLCSVMSDSLWPYWL